jgi:hypothetical protein
MKKIVASLIAVAGAWSAGLPAHASIQDKLLCSFEMKDGVYDGFFNGDFDVKDGRLFFSPNEFMSGTLNLRPIAVNLQGAEAAENAVNAKKLLVYYHYGDGGIMIPGFRPLLSRDEDVRSFGADLISEGVHTRLRARLSQLSASDADYPGYRVIIDSKIPREALHKPFHLVFKNGEREWGRWSFKAMAPDHVDRFVEVAKAKFTGRPWSATNTSSNPKECQDASSGW